MNSSASERFEAAYRRVWGALHAPDDTDLSQHEMEVLHHVSGGAPREGVALTWLATHLAWPKSTTCVVVKDLERRGFLVRKRHPDDERRLAIELTSEGRRRVAASRVLDPKKLSAALAALPRADRTRVVGLLERVAAAAEEI